MRYFAGAVRVVTNESTGFIFLLYQAKPTPFIPKSEVGPDINIPHAIIGHWLALEKTVLAVFAPHRYSIAE